MDETIYPILFLPKKCTSLETNCEPSDNVYIDVNITSPDTEGNNTCIYQGFCNIKLVDQYDVNIQNHGTSEETMSDIDQMQSVIEDHTYDEPHPWSESLSPNARTFDVSESMEYSVCHESHTSIMVEQSSMCITQNVYNYKETVMFSSNDEHSNKIVQQEKLDPDDYEDDGDDDCGDDDDDDYEYRPYLTPPKKSRNREDREYMDLQLENSALKQLMSSDIQSRSRLRKNILFMGSDAECGHTIQQIGYYDSSVECCGRPPSVDNEVVIDNSASPGRKRYQCMQCRQIFDRISDYRDHVVNHSSRSYNYSRKCNVNLITCSECGKNLKTKEKFDEHYMRHGNPELECQKCRKVFASKYTLRVHKKIHTRRHRCPYCFVKTFNKLKDMRSHVSKIHCLYLCQFCNHVASHYTEFMTHKQEHEIRYRRDSSETERADSISIMDDVTSDHNLVSNHDTTRDHTVMSYNDDIRNHTIMSYNDTRDNKVLSDHDTRDYAFMTENDDTRDRTVRSYNGDTRDSKVTRDHALITDNDDTRDHTVRSYNDDTRDNKAMSDNARRKHAFVTDNDDTRDHTVMSYNDDTRDNKVLSDHDRRDHAVRSYNDDTRDNKILSDHDRRDHAVRSYNDDTRDNKILSDHDRRDHAFMTHNDGARDHTVMSYNEDTRDQKVLNDYDAISDDDVRAIPVPGWTVEEKNVDLLNIEKIKKADSVIAKVMSNEIFFAEKVKKINRKRGKQCVVCLKSFDRVSELKRHLVEHVVRSTLTKAPVDRSGALVLTCDVCRAASFTAVDRYKAHLREHAKLTLYKCTLCNKSFSDSSNFSKHKKTHGAPFFQCDLCSRRFHSKKMLIQHMDYHNKNKPLKCPNCVQIFHFESTLNKHVKLTHMRGSSSRFRCRFCHVYFRSLKEKWDHEWKSHKARKMIVDCLMCIAKFRKFSELKKHCFDVHGVDIPRSKWLLKKKNNKAGPKSPNKCFEYKKIMK